MEELGEESMVDREVQDGGGASSRRGVVKIARYPRRATDNDRTVQLSCFPAPRATNASTTDHSTLPLANFWLQRALSQETTGK